MPSEHEKPSNVLKQTECDSVKQNDYINKLTTSSELKKWTFLFLIYFAWGTLRLA